MAAPAKPPVGESCNGCGVCCAAETCPVGLLLFRRRTGPCPALTWDGGARRYWCGLVIAPGKYLSWLPGAWSGWAARLMARWIAAGRTCDSDVELDEP